MHDGRYTIENVWGCYAPVDRSWLSIVLLYIWPIVFLLVACYYAGESFPDFLSFVSLLMYNRSGPLSPLPLPHPSLHPATEQSYLAFEVPATLSPRSFHHYHTAAPIRRSTRPIRGNWRSASLHLVRGTRRLGLRFTTALHLLTATAGSMVLDRNRMDHSDHFGHGRRSIEDVQGCVRGNRAWKDLHFLA